MCSSDLNLPCWSLYYNWSVLSCRANWLLFPILWYVSLYYCLLAYRCLSLIHISQEWIPPDAYIDAWLDTIFTAGVDKIADNVSFAVTPLYSFQAVWAYVTLPQSEAAFMGGCEYGELAACDFSCWDPLVGSQLGGVDNVVIFNGTDTVIALSVACLLYTSNQCYFSCSFL